MFRRPPPDRQVESQGEQQNVDDGVAELAQEASQQGFGAGFRQRVGAMGRQRAAGLFSGEALNRQLSHQQSQVAGLITTVTLRVSIWSLKLVVISMR